MVCESSSQPAPRSRAFAQGLAGNEPHSKIVREDLERLAAEIAG